MGISSATAVSLTELAKFAEPRPREQSVAEKAAKDKEAETIPSDTGQGRGIKIDFEA